MLIDFEFINPNSSKISNAYFLCYIKIPIIVGLCYLNPQEIIEFAMIFCLKVVTKVLFHLGDVMGSILVRTMPLMYVWQVNQSLT